MLWGRPRTAPAAAGPLAWRSSAAAPWRPPPAPALARAAPGGARHGVSGGGAASLVPITWFPNGARAHAGRLRVRGSQLAKKGVFSSRTLETSSTRLRWPSAEPKFTLNSASCGVGRAAHAESTRGGAAGDASQRRAYRQLHEVLLQLGQLVLHLHRAPAPHTGAGEDDDGTAPHKTCLRFRYDSTIVRSHSLHPHPYTGARAWRQMRRGAVSVESGVS
eukprot:COSAG01_NODE_1543_length_9973_cov_3.152015_5_plen_219_part_00